MPRRAQGGRRPCAPRALLYSAAAWLWLCCASMWGTCVLIEAAQRFVLEDEGIREIILPPSSTPPNGGRGGKVPLPSQIKASVNAKQNKLRGLDEQAPAAAVSTACEAPCFPIRPRACPAFAPRRRSDARRRPASPGHSHS